VILCPRGRQGALLLPNTVTRIAANAFADCDDLTSIGIPGSVREIPSGVFDDCDGLQNIVVAADNPAFASVDGTLVDRSTGTVILCPRGRQGALLLPNTVTRIAANAFADCDGLTSIVIPGSVKEIPSGAFDDCDGLQSVVIESGVEVIGEFVWHIETLPRPVRPEFVIDAYGAFQGCSALRSISIPGSVKRIGPGVFDGCVSLTTVTLGVGVKTIGGAWQPDQVGAFSRCTSLTNIMIPESVTSIDGSSFARCTSLASIAVSPSSTTYASLDGILTNKSGTTILVCPPGRTGSLTLPATITSLARFAFDGCRNLTAIRFLGNAPSFEANVFDDAGKSTIYYRADTSGWSNPFAGRPAETFAIAPTSPTAVAAVPGNARASLGWQAPSSTGGSPVTDFTVQYSSDGGARWTTFPDGTSTANSATVTGLTNGTRYVFRVAAVNAAGTGGWS
ncbi:MAG: leucine-rich repeat protein, partial [Planctomycetia bacterium]